MTQRCTKHDGNGQRQAGHVFAVTKVLRQIAVCTAAPILKAALTLRQKESEVGAQSESLLNLNGGINHWNDCCIILLSLRTSSYSRDVTWELSERPFVGLLPAAGENHPAPPLPPLAPSPVRRSIWKDPAYGMNRRRHRRHSRHRHRDHWRHHHYHRPQRGRRHRRRRRPRYRRRDGHILCCHSRHHRRRRRCRRRRRGRHHRRRRRRFGRGIQISQYAARELGT